MSVRERSWQWGCASEGFVSRVHPRALGILARQRRRGSTAWWRLRSLSGHVRWGRQVALSKGGHGNEVTCAPTSQVALVLFASWFLLVQSDMGGCGAKWKLRCSLGEGGSITCRGIAAFVPDGRQLGAVEECDGGVLALRGVPALGPEGEFAFLEYVEKAYRETQVGLSGWPSPPELSSACGRACRRGRYGPSTAETSGRRELFVERSWQGDGASKGCPWHLVGPSASAPGRGTMPAKASLGASRVSVRERSVEGAGQQSCLVCPAASSGLAETGYGASKGCP